MRTEPARLKECASTFIVPKEKSDEPLRECVREAVDDYFLHLNGHEPARLYEMVIEEVEQPLLESVMRHTGSNQTRAAEILGISRSTLRKKLARYGIT